MLTMSLNSKQPYPCRSSRYLKCEMSPKFYLLFQTSFSALHSIVDDNSILPVAQRKTLQSSLTPFFPLCLTSNLSGNSVSSNFNISIEYSHFSPLRPWIKQTSYLSWTIQAHPNSFVFQHLPQTHKLYCLLSKQQPKWCLQNIDRVTSLFKNLLRLPLLKIAIFLRVEANVLILTYKALCDFCTPPLYIIYYLFSRLIISLLFYKRARILLCFIYCVSPTQETLDTQKVFV